MQSADLQGYVLAKSATPKNAWNAGGYMLLRDGCIVLGDRFNSSLDEIEALLEGEGAKWLSTARTGSAGNDEE